MKTPAHDLTIIICVYNGERFVLETLESLANQTHKHFELLVVDDASTDTTSEVVRAFFRAKPTINGTIVTLPENVGLARARKFAEGVIKTEFAMFFDADDVAHPDMVGRLHAVLREQPACMGASCQCKYIDSRGKLIGGGIYLGPKSKEEFFERARAAKLMFLPPTMFRMAAAAQVGGRAVDGFPEGKIRYQDMCEDLDLWTRMSDLYVEGKYFLVLREELFFYRKHLNSVSSSSDPMNDRMRHIKANLLRRRQGLPDQTFVEFKALTKSGLSLADRLHDLASKNYKRAGFYYMQRKHHMFIAHLVAAAVLSPRYVIGKIWNNLVPRG